MPKDTLYKAYLREDIGQRATEEAKRQHLSLSAWVRMVIGKYLDRQRAKRSAQ